MIYLDNAATTLQKPPSVARAMADALRHASTPGRGGHAAAMRAADTAFLCREEAAKLFSLSNPEQVVFTFNATHALNIAVRSLVKPGGTVLISGYEHNAVVRPLYDIANVAVKIASSAPFDSDGILESFRREMTPEVSAVICTHVSNVFGFVLPIQEISELCRQRKKAFILDASQSAGSQSVSANKLGADFIAMPGHKGLYGPQGTGLLLCKNTDCVPLLFGGTGSNSDDKRMPSYLPDRLEAGTHNIPGIAGLLEGIRFVQSRGVDAIRTHEERLITFLCRELEGLPDTEVFASWAGNQGPVLSLRCSRFDCEELACELGRRGIALRAGLHCAPLAHESAGTKVSGTLRLSVSAFTSEKEIKAFLYTFQKILH